MIFYCKLHPRLQPDDMGYADAGWTLGAGGDMVTPFMNSLAKSGVILENYHTEPVCSPTRGALMTVLRKFGVVWVVK